MAAKKGTPKTGGRKKGTPNKKTQALIDKCADFGVDPFEVLLEFAKNKGDPDMRFAAAKELSQYLYPKRKATEISVDDDTGIKVIIEDYTSDPDADKDSAPTQAKAVPTKR